MDFHIEIVVEHVLLELDRRCDYALCATVFVS